METTVTLQPPLEYSAFWIWIALAILLASFILFGVALYFLRKNLHRAETAPKAPLLDPFDDSARTQCIEMIHKILAEYCAHNIDKRTGYQQLSRVIRTFVHDTTGVDVEKSTLKEIKQMQIPHLARLIEECYIPEFAEAQRAEGKNLEKYV